MDPVHLLTQLHVEVVAVSTATVVDEDTGVAATVATITTTGAPSRTTMVINPSTSSVARRATPDSAASSVLTLPSPAPPEQSRSASSASYGIDTNWYTDTGATDHITGELEKLTVRDKYHGNDKVHAANGAGMRINQIGRSFVRTPNQNLVLNNVLYVPEANKSLASVHRLTSDNHAFIEYYSNYFLIKDQATKNHP